MSRVGSPRGVQANPEPCNSNSNSNDSFFQTPAEPLSHRFPIAFPSLRVPVAYPVCYMDILPNNYGTEHQGRTRLTPYNVKSRGCLHHLHLISSDRSHPNTVTVEVYCSSTQSKGTLWKTHKPNVDHVHSHNLTPRTLQLVGGSCCTPQSMTCCQTECAQSHVVLGFSGMAIDWHGGTPEGMLAPGPGGSLLTCTVPQAKRTGAPRERFTRKVMAIVIPVIICLILSSILVAAAARCKA
jgi:hypothetical protein